MARKNMKLDALRAETQRLQRNAGSKMGRLKKQGINAAGSEFDPRRDSTKVSRYNSKQLASYNKQLSAFNSRYTKFVPDAYGKPIPQAEWNRYVRGEKTFNRKFREHFDKIAGSMLPSGMTVGERNRDLVSDKMRANKPVNTPHEFHRTSKAVTSRTSLDKLIKDMWKKNNTRFTEEEYAREQENFDKMAIGINNPDFIAAVKDLTPEQFGDLWNFTSFTTHISVNYESYKDSLTDKEQGYPTDVDITELDKAWELVEWAKTL